MPGFANHSLAPFAILLLLALSPPPLGAQTDCSAIQTQCKSPNDGSPLSPECIALRQRCDPYFVLPPGTAIPGQPQAYAPPEIPKLVSPRPYGNSSPPYAGGWHQPLPGWPGYYRPERPDGWYPAWGTPGWAITDQPYRGWRINEDFPPPFRYLQEPFRSGFGEHPPDEDFLFFWGSGTYYPYGGHGYPGPPFRPQPGGPPAGWPGH